MKGSNEKHKRKNSGSHILCCRINIIASSQITAAHKNDEIMILFSLREKFYPSKDIFFSVYEINKRIRILCLYFSTRQISDIIEKLLCVI